MIATMPQRDPRHSSVALCEAKTPASDIVAGDALSEDGEPPPLLHEALAAHQLLGATYELHSGTPLPKALLTTARLHAMSEAELWLHAPPSSQAGRPPPVAFVSACSEWHALTRLGTALEPCRHARAAKAQVESLLLALCHVPPEPSPPRLQRADAAARALLASIGSRGDVRVAECAVGGRGLVAGSAVAVGSCAVSLPARALISAATARAELPAGVVRLLSREGPWAEHLQVMLLLMRERWRGQASRLAPALALLAPPDDEAGPPSAWAEDELGCLAGTDAYWSAHAARGELLELRHSLMPQLGPLLGMARGGSEGRTVTAGEGVEAGKVGIATGAGAEAEVSGVGGAVPGAEAGAGAACTVPSQRACGDASDAYSEARWLWAKSVLDTRAMALPAALGPDLPRGTLVLAPVIDLANHAPAPKLILDVDKGTGIGDEARLCLRATAPVAPGEQLFISYGRFDAQELFLHYGILPPEPCPPPTGQAEAPHHTGGGLSLQPLPEPAVPPAHPPSPEVANSAAPPAALPAPPLLLRLALTPCTPLQEDDALLGRVLLLMAHLGMGMDVSLPAHLYAGLGCVGQASSPADGGGAPLLEGIHLTSKSNAAVVTVPCQTGKPPPAARSIPSALPAAVPALPARLLGAARLLAVTSDAELSLLPVARATGPAPLSPANEAAALRLLSRCCEEAIGAIEGAIEGGVSAAEAGVGDEGAGGGSSEGLAGGGDGDGPRVGMVPLRVSGGGKRQRVGAPGANTGVGPDPAAGLADAHEPGEHTAGGPAHSGRRRGALAFRAQVLRGYRGLHDVVRAHQLQAGYQTACPGSR